MQSVAATTTMTQELHATINHINKKNMNTLAGQKKRLSNSIGYRLLQQNGGNVF